MRRALFLLLALLCAVEARAVKGPGTSAAPILQVPLGARATGMGGAFTAVADDVSTLYYNPAGLSNLNHRELSFMYQRGIEGQNMEYIAGATPIPFSGLIGEGFTSVGASLLFAQNGKMEVNRVNTDGSFLSSENISAGGDLVFTLGYSERAGEMEFRRGGQVYRLLHLVGVNAKIIRSTLAQQYSATAMAADAGYFLYSPETRFSYGLSVLNIGTKMKYVEEGDPLPVTARTGVAYRPQLSDFGINTEQTLLAAADVDYLVIDRDWHVNFGLEYSPLRRFSLRLGYQFNQDVGGPSFGFGADWRRLRIAYGWALQSSLSDVHRLSFTYRFGRVPGYQREFRRRPYIESMPEREELQGIEDEKPQEIAPARRPRRHTPDRQRAAPGWIY
ncbi:MAG: PorV/PorQ family protein [Elusimicrobiota bacterium]